MIFGKHINRYYLKYLPVLILGFLALLLVDYMQLVLPELYGMVIEGIETGFVEHSDGSTYAFDLSFLLDKICRPLLFVIVSLVFGRFLWRVCFFGSGIKLETDLRGKISAIAERVSGMPLLDYLKKKLFDEMIENTKKYLTMYNI